jgi:beta-lactamase class D
MIETSPRTLRARLGAAAPAALTLFGTAACGTATHEAAPHGAAVEAVRPGRRHGKHATVARELLQWLNVLPAAA